MYVEIAEFVEHCGSCVETVQWRRGIYEDGPSEDF